MSMGKIEEKVQQQIVLKKVVEGQSIYKTLNKNVKKNNISNSILVAASISNICHGRIDRKNKN